MKKYFGNYLGLCVDNNDPQKRGRVQVFIPHILPALYENWNDAGQDIQMLCVGDNLPDSIPGDILEKLKKILPWAEASMPVMGTSAPGNLTQGGAAFQPSVVAGVAGAGVAVPQGGSYYDQSPVPDPPTATTTPTGNVNYSNLIYDKAWQGEGQDPTFKALLSKISSQVGKPFSITSGYRTPEYNNKVSDTGFSGPHTEGTAADISTRGWTNQEKANLINVASANGIKGIGIYNNFIHIDTSKNGVRTWGPVPSWAAGPIANHKNRSTYQAGLATGLTSSTSSQMAAVNPLKNPNPINQKASVADPTAQNAGGAGGTLSVPGIGQVSGNGKVAEQALYNTLYDNLKTKLADTPIPSDITKYGVSADLNGLTTLMMKVAYKESRFTTTAVGDQGYFSRQGVNGPIPGGSHGLFQLSPQDALTYNFLGIKGQGDFILSNGRNTNVQSWTLNQLYDPNFNINATTSIWANSIKRFGSIENRILKGYGWLANREFAKLQQYSGQGLAQNYSPTNQAITGLPGDTGLFADSLPGDAETGLPQTGGNLVGNPDSWGPTPTVNINNMAAGMFSYPAAGALLWVFFREGNPLFPVYFGASYGEREWASAYRLPGPGEDGVGYKPSPSEENPVTSVGGTWNIGKVGVHQWHYVDDPTNPLNNERSYAIGGHDGSNIAFTEGLQTFFTKFDRRDQIEGDRWVTTLGFEERWNQGNVNTNTLGDVVVRVGNTSQEAVDAVNKINDYIKQIMQPLTVSNSPNGGQTQSFSPPPSPYGQTARTTANNIAKNTPTSFPAPSDVVILKNYNEVPGTQAAGVNWNPAPRSTIIPAVYNSAGQPISYQPTGKTAIIPTRTGTPQNRQLLTEQDLRNLGYKPR